MPLFHHHDLTLLNPVFDSPLVDVVTELEHLRRLRLAGTTPAPVFFQLKRIFHMLESLGSARIEGNHTTLADYIESRLEAQPVKVSDQLREMINIEEAMAAWLAMQRRATQRSFVRRASSDSDLLG